MGRKRRFSVLIHRSALSSGRRGPATKIIRAVLLEHQEFQVTVREDSRTRQ
jgi:hypothetical protein